MTERKSDRYRSGEPATTATDDDTDTQAARESERRRGMGMRALPILGAIGAAIAMFLRRRR
jgi:hypothetical protein